MGNNHDVFILFGVENLQSRLITSFQTLELMLSLLPYASLVGVLSLLPYVSLVGADGGVVVLPCFVTARRDRLHSHGSMQDRSRGLEDLHCACVR